MPAPLTDEWIEEQLKLCEAASQGPWRDGFDDGSGRIDDHSGAYITFGKLNQFGLPQYIIDGGNSEYDFPKGVLKQENVDFIIAARAGYPKVLERLRILQKVIDNIAAYTEARQFQSYCEMIFSALSKFRTDNSILI